MRARVYLFDIDGTLLQTGGAGWRALTGAMGEEFGVEQLSGIELRGRTDYAIAGELLRLARVPVGFQSRQRLLKSYYSRLTLELQKGAGGVLPGVWQLLDRLRSDPQAVLGVLTGNGLRGAEIKLGHFGLREWFSVGVYGDRHEHRTDLARDALGVLRKKFGADLEGGHVCIIGDTPSDVECALAIDARSVAVATGGFADEDLVAAGAHLVLRDLTEWPH